MNDNSDSGTGYHLVNSHSLVEAENSPELQAVLASDVAICDGKPLSLLLRKRDRNLTQIRGADLMRNILRSSKSEHKHFFLGGTESALDGLLAEARLRNPELVIAGFYSPPFEREFRPSLLDWVNRIRASGASIVWVGLGTPKQDFVTYELARNLSCQVLAVGAAFDYIAGTLKEAPRLVQIVGLEWLYRLIKEPRRLAKRYLIGNFIFLRIIFRSRF